LFGAGGFEHFQNPRRFRRPGFQAPRLVDLSNGFVAPAQAAEGHKSA
jgi:hypothetical protein